MPYKTVAAVSNDEDRDKCRELGIDTVDYPNSPLTLKFQAALDKAMSMRPGYVLIMGSDDVCSDGYYELCEKMMEMDVDFIGCKDIVMTNLLAEKSSYWPGYTNFRRGEPIGCGRFISAELISKMGGKLWNKKNNRNVDLISWTAINKVAKNIQIISIDRSKGIDMQDLKTSENINKFSKFNHCDSCDYLDWWRK